MGRGDRFSRTSQLRSAIKVLPVVVIFVGINVHVIFVYGREFWRRVGERILGFGERGEGDHSSGKEVRGADQELGTQLLLR